MRATKMPESTICHKNSDQLEKTHDGAGRNAAVPLFKAYKIAPHDEACDNVKGRKGPLHDHPHQSQGDMYRI